MNKILIGDVTEKLKELPDGSIQCVVTSPPYWGLRDYGVDGQLGLEREPSEYVARLVEVFREVKRVLKDDGTFWLNVGDSYSGSGKGPAGNLGKTHNERHLEAKTGGLVPEGTKPKDLVGVPWMLAFALRADGWYLRQDVIWAKPNPMPESVKDRCTKSHEHLFMLTKSSRYLFDAEAVREGDHNLRDVWNIATKPYKGAHFAVFPEAIPERCIRAGTRNGDIVLDPFAGSGTTLAAAKRMGRQYVGIELNAEYLPLIEERLAK